MKPPEVVAELSRFVYATRQEFVMRELLRHPIIVLLIGFVLLAPLFEAFDNSQDLVQRTDFLVLLCVFVFTGLFILCKRTVTFLFQVLVIALAPFVALTPYRNRSIRVEVSPPESLMALGGLRI